MEEQLTGAKFNLTIAKYVLKNNKITIYIDGRITRHYTLLFHLRLKLYN